jgi:hypothetical protein
MKIIVWKKLVESKLALARAKGLIDNDFNIKTVDKEKLIEIGIADSTGKASVGSASDYNSDLGDVDFLQFSDEEPDEFADQKNKNVLDGFAIRKNEEARIDKKYQGWFEKILTHKVKDNDEMRDKRKKLTVLVDKVKKDYTKDSTLHF